MKRFWILLCCALLFFAFQGVPLCAAQPVSNFSILDSLSLHLAQKAAISLHSSNVALDIPNHSSAWLIRQNTIRAMAAHNISIHDSSKTVLHTGIAACGVQYALHSERDSLLRTLRVELRYAVDNTAPLLLSADYHDVIARSDIPLAESPRYEFSSSLPPPLPHSTWDEILEPLIVVAALATTVTLLFTVRSQ